MKRKYYLRGLGIGILVTALVFVITKPSELTDEEIINRAEELGYVKAEDEEISPTISLKDLMETGTPAPTEVINITETPVPTEVAEVTETPVATETPTPTEMPVETPEPTSEPEPTPTPEAALTPTPEPTKEPTATPEPTKAPTPKPTATPEPTATTVPTVPTEKPTPKPTAATTPTAVPTNSPVQTIAPQETLTPAPTSEPEGTVITATISVERGNTAKAVCDKIEAAGIIEDGEDLKNYIVRNQMADYINVGTYTLSSDMTYEEIVKILTER